MNEKCDFDVALHGSLLVVAAAFAGFMAWDEFLNDGMWRETHKNVEIHIVKHPPQRILDPNLIDKWTEK
jgi:hypothetical protein